jgi:hypothetical protein
LLSSPALSPERTPGVELLGSDVTVYGPED